MPKAKSAKKKHSRARANEKTDKTAKRLSAKRTSSKRVAKKKAATKPAKKAARKRTAAASSSPPASSPRRAAMAGDGSGNWSNVVLNCVESHDPESDWSLEDAFGAGLVTFAKRTPKRVDLRFRAWAVRHQGTTGACTGFAAADGLLYWHFVNAGKIHPGQRLSPRFLWMANKETDDLCSYPTTFLETAGTQTKSALKIARRYGCALEEDLPMDGPLSTMNVTEFYAKAARLRIATYHRLSRRLEAWRKWLAHQGPILSRLNVDATWDAATENGGHLRVYRPNTARGGHAICLVGYTPEYFIVRNSWGTGWGDGGFAYASNEYAAEAFTEAYGATL